MAYFKFSHENEPRPIRQAAYDLLNSIELSIAQLEREAPARKNFQERRMAAVREYCNTQGLQPADVAAQAIIVRCNAIQSAWARGINPRTEYRDTYHEYATGPIDPSEFGLEPDYQE